MMRALLVAAMLAAALPAAAETLAAAPETGAFPTPLAGTLSRVLVALALISGAGAALAWWSRRRRGPNSSGPSRIQVLASRAIGPRHHVVLIEVGERRLLLGTAPESVRALADLSEVPPFAAELERRLDAIRPEVLDA
jgi:flagellar biosynthetic protein FliO